MRIISPHSQPVAQTAKSAVSQVAKPARATTFRKFCRFGNRRCSRFGNLRHQSPEILAAAVLAAALVSGPATHGGDAQPTLKAAFKDCFRIGAALNERQFEETDSNAVALIKAQFNTITPENALKWESVHPKPEHFDFDEADRYVAFGTKYNMFVVGHTLVWHSQTPAWVFRDDKGNPADRETLLRRMHEHISTVVGRYRGRVNGWDVVNEALEEDGQLRKSPWLRIIGEDYLAKAFQFAHEADPKAELYYNDFSLDNAPKREGAIALVKKLQAQGIQVAAIGMQGHYKMDWPDPKETEASIEAFAKLGVKVMFTELDFDVLPAPGSYRGADIAVRYELRKELDPYAEGLPDAMQQELAARYGDFFSLFARHCGQISRVTFWGVTDGDSWLNFYPVRGRTAYPLLFDRHHQPKPAFQAVIAAAAKPK
jgi:endo-1,4-beta-xylanase